MKKKEMNAILKAMDLPKAFREAFIEALPREIRKSQKSVPFRFGITASVTFCKSMGHHTFDAEAGRQMAFGYSIGKVAM